MTALHGRCQSIYIFSSLFFSTGSCGRRRLLHFELPSCAVVRLSDEEPVRDQREECLAESSYLRLTLETTVLASSLESMAGFVLRKTWASFLDARLWHLVPLGESLKFCELFSL